MQYRYHVAYQFNGAEGVQGFGDIDCTMAYPISSGEVLKEVRNMIAASSLEKFKICHANIVILSWQRYENEE